MAIQKLDLEVDDFEDIVIKIEKSLAIKFQADDFQNTHSYGDFIAVVLSKINAKPTTDSTPQQAFYKLRAAILAEKQIEIKTDTPLADIFPRETRRQDIKAIEKRLDFKLDALAPKTLIIRLLILLVVVSLIGLFVRPQLGLIGIVSSIFLFEMAYRFGIEFPIYSVGELVSKMVKDNYNKSRRTPETANLEEIKKVVTTIFEEDLRLDKGALVADTQFIFISK
jgi:uncharacterized membrane protein